MSPGHTGRPAAGHRPAVSPFRQPKAVWAVAFACVVSFMGIGLVDSILPALSRQLNASPSSVELLFTSYLVVTATPAVRCTSSRSWPTAASPPPTPGAGEFWGPFPRLVRVGPLAHQAGCLCAPGKLRAGLVRPVWGICRLC